jgi:flagellar assembly protein FliH
MGKSVLSDRQYQYSDQGYVVDNVYWQDEIKRRAWEEINRQQEDLKNAGLAPAAPDFQAYVPESFGAEVPAVADAEVAEPVVDEAEVMRAKTAEAARQIEETAKAKADEIEKEAKLNAEKIISTAAETARVESEKIKTEAVENGQKEGRDLGYQAGLEAGAQEGKKTYSGVVSDLNSVFQKTVEERKKLLTEMKPLMIDLVGEALQACLKKKAKNGAIVVHFVEEALRKALGRTKLMVHLNPADVEAVESEVQNLQLAVGAGEIELVPDARIEQGGCLLETEAGSVDAQLSTVVSQVKDVLRDES